jgi:hypothetical protein
MAIGLRNTNYIDVGNTNVIPSAYSSSSLDYANMFAPAAKTTNPMGDWGGTGLSLDRGNMLGMGGSTPPGGGMFDGFSLFGNATQKGQFGNILGGLSAAGSLFMGMKQYGLQKEALAQAKDQFNKNYAAQKGLTNSSLSDRQIARNASGPGYQDTAGYMAQYGIA